MLKKICFEAGHVVPSSSSGGACFPAVLVQILHELNDFSSTSAGKPQGALAVKREMMRYAVKNVTEEKFDRADLYRSAAQLV